MKANIRRRFNGPIEFADLGHGEWQLTVGSFPSATIFLRTVQPSVLLALRDEHIDSIEIEWRAEEVVVIMTGASGLHTVRTGSALVHEPLQFLYETLPLAAFDAKAKRFWRRVFTLMRLPGGRVLLRFIARRNRGTA